MKSTGGRDPLDGVGALVLCRDQSRDVDRGFLCLCCGNESPNSISKTSIIDDIGQTRDKLTALSRPSDHEK